MTKFYLGFDLTGQGGLGTFHAGGGTINEFDALADVTSGAASSTTATQGDFSNGMTYNSDTNQWIMGVNNTAFYIYNSLADVQANNFVDSVPMLNVLNYNNGITYNADTGTYFAAYKNALGSAIVEYATIEDMANFANPLRSIAMAPNLDWTNGIEYDSVNNVWYGAYHGTTAFRGALVEFASVEDLATYSNPISQVSYVNTQADYEMGIAIVPCFTTGTLINTSNGPVVVEKLSEGDLVLTCDNGLQPIRWVGSRKLSEKDLVSSPGLRPIRIRRGALGMNQPERDLTVSPQHRVLVRSKVAQRMFGTEEVLVAAKHLLEIDGIEIANDMKEVEYFHILFDRHEIIYSNGAQTESFHPGEQAMKSLDADAREEILILFPELRDQDTAQERQCARTLTTGRMGRRLAMRHHKNQSDLVQQGL